MKNDTLEKLLIDRAAGQLTPDVGELLDDHLKRDTAARKEAAEIEDTMRLARLALAEEKVVPLPASRRPWRNPSPVWAMAACFVGGLALGILALGGRNPALQTAAVLKTQSVAATPAADSDFWSARRLQAESRSVAPKTDPVIWKSIFKKPEVL